MCELIGLLDKYFIHFIRVVFDLLNGHLSYNFLFFGKELLNHYVEISILFVLWISFNVFHPVLYPIEDFEELHFSVVLNIGDISTLIFAIRVGVRNFLCIFFLRVSLEFLYRKQ